MRLDDLPDGSTCFVDANIFVYHFGRDPASVFCNRFFRRVESGTLTAYTTAIVVSDALHKVMLTEIQTVHVTAKPLAHVQRHPEFISGLTHYPAACAAVGRMRLTLLGMDLALFSEAGIIAAREQLLTTEAGIVAAMRRASIVHLVTNDNDFDTVSGIQVWKPR